VRPSIVAGKAVYVEWPLDRDLQVAKEMTSLAAQHNIKTIVGLQGSFTPAIQKLQSLVDKGAIGKILGSTVVGALGNADATESKNVRYFLQREVGGNVMSIHSGHCLEFVTAGKFHVPEAIKGGDLPPSPVTWGHTGGSMGFRTELIHLLIKPVLGQFKSFGSSCSIRRPFIDIVNGDKVIEKGARNSVPDQILMYGTVEPSNAPVRISLHSGPGFPGLPRLDWRIQGEKGWLRLTSSVFFLNIGSPDMKLELFNAETGTVEEISSDVDEWEVLPLPAHNIAKLYEAYRKNEWHPTFDWALKKHELLDRMWQTFDKENAAE
jgi:predicted dehydrogenase